MRVVAIHRDAVVVTSRMWQTTATALRAGGEAMLIDSPYFPDELEVLPQVLAQSGFEPDALLATHADWDHLLGRLAFPGLSLGVAESSAERLRAEPGAAQRELRGEDARTYAVRPRPLSLGSVQSLPVPGRLDLGDARLELHPAEGHTRDGMAIMCPHAGVLVCGDYLSGVEIPLVGDSAEDYIATLARLAPLVERAEVVVPGHGAPLARDEALRILDEDTAYVEALAAGAEPALPEGRDSPRQRELHRAQLT
ncbi:MAG TPA: MBL fold metallo-hydrolase [Thermoleophilaceae bacterium]|nr:MBL fold metallo-hydrolase [Thermoleophilaceae bacterium]